MKKILFLLLIAFANLVACQSSDENGGEPKGEPTQEPEKGPEATLPPLVARLDINLTAMEKQVVQQNNAFAFKLLQSVYANEDAKDNIFLSPLSASLALLMLNNGAAGDTQKEIQDALGYGVISRDALNTYAQKMIDAMQELDTRGVFESANSIWIKQDFQVLDAFKDVNKTYYAAEVRNENFGNPATLDVINGWVKEKTHDKIPKILDEIDPNAVMYLINALYFKGYWTSPFNESATTPIAFHNLDGTSPELPTMQQAITDGYYIKKDACSLLELPFGNKAFSVMVLLPDQGVSLQSMLKNMDAEWWNDCLSTAPTTNIEVYLRLPRFKIEYERTLNNELKALGMKSMFTDNANFSLINATAPLAVSIVKQKTFAEVNEQGMEAAAVTVAGMAMTSLPEVPPTRINFYVDRPFLFFLKEKSTGSILFTGIIKNL